MYLELAITSLATGMVILLYSLWRARRIPEYSRIIDSVQHDYEISVTPVGDASMYEQSVARQWIMDNIVRKKHGRIIGRLQAHLCDNTIIAFLWIGFGAGIAGFVLAFILIKSVEAAGASLLFFAIAVFTALGPGDAKTSEELLNHLSQSLKHQLRSEDLPYAQVALNYIKKWTIISFSIGILLIAISPWADLLPFAIATVVAVFSEFVFWRPALFLAGIWMPLTIFYLATVFPFIIYLLLYARIRMTEKP